MSRSYAFFSHLTSLSYSIAVRGAIPTAILALLTFASARVQAQTRHWNNTDISLGGTAEFTAIPSSTPISEPSLALQDAAGLLLEVQEHPYTFTGFAAQYRYGRHLASAPTLAVTADPSTHELTGAYLLHSHLPILQPFLCVGGGGRYQDSASGTKGKLAPAGLVEAGFDIPAANSHLGLRFSARALEIYTNKTAVSPSQWTLQVEPVLSGYFRF